MSSTHLDIARQRLLAPAGMDEGDLDKVFGQLLGHAVDSGDLYFQSTRFESWVLEDGIVKEGTHSIEQGAGVRAISGDKTGLDGGACNCAPRKRGQVAGLAQRG
jgi:TldD protein